MSDIVEKLLSRAWEDRHHRKYRDEAALVITSLRAQVQEMALQALSDSGQAIENLADASRYQWLRSRLPGSAYRISGVIYSEGGAGVDAAIDAAIRSDGLNPPL